MKNVYDFTVKDRKGESVSLSDYKGKVLIIVNTATGCGFTHRLVIKALLKHEPMPPAPKWHFWCKNRRS